MRNVSKSPLAIGVVAMAFILVILDGALSAQADKQATKVADPQRVWGQVLEFDGSTLKLKTDVGVLGVLIPVEVAKRIPTSKPVVGQDAFVFYTQSGDTKTATKVLLGVTKAAAEESIASPQWLARHQEYQRAARAAFNAATAHEGKDCPDARTTYDANMCLSEALDTARRHFAGVPPDPQASPPVVETLWRRKREGAVSMTRGSRRIGEDYLPLSPGEFDDRALVVFHPLALATGNRLDAIIDLGRDPPEQLNVLTSDLPVETTGKHHEVDVTPLVGAAPSIRAEQHSRPRVEAELALQRSQVPLNRGDYSFISH